MSYSNTLIHFNYIAIQGNIVVLCCLAEWCTHNITNTDEYIEHRETISITHSRNNITSDALWESLLVTKIILIINTCYFLTYKMHTTLKNAKLSSKSTQSASDSEPLTIYRVGTIFERDLWRRGGGGSRRVWAHRGDAEGKQPFILYFRMTASLFHAQRSHDSENGHNFTIMRRRQMQLYI